MMAIFKNLPVKTMKESKIDAVLKHFSHRDYFSQLLWDVAVYIQQDLGMAIHCQLSAKVEAYKYFLTESFVRSIFKVWTKKLHSSNFKVSSFSELEPSFNAGNFTHSAIDLQSIEAHFGAPRRIGQKRPAGDIDSQDDSDTEPISDKLARLAPKAEDISVIRSPKTRKKPKVNAPTIIKQEVEDITMKQVQVPGSVTNSLSSDFLESIM